LVLIADEIIKQGTYSIKFSSAKKYQHKSGNLVLTRKCLLFLVNDNLIKNSGIDTSDLR